MATGLTLRTIILFVIVVAGQIGGSTTLGLTDGFTRPLWSVVCALAYVASLYALALMIKEGAPLSMLMPLLAAIVPLCAIGIAVTILGEAASWARIGLLAFSCLVVGAASLV